MKAKKHLGQNFLKSTKALSDIVSSARVSSKDTVLEIGPGRGVLTEKLLEKASRVIAIEKDKDLIYFLEDKFQKEIKDKKLILKEADILSFDLKSLPKKYKLVANIPYYITGAIFEKFLDSENKPEMIVLVVQKEVAERIVAKDGKESILSISVKVFGKPKYVSKIPARYFSPKPKVDSAIILVDDIKNPFKNDKEKALFFQLVKAGFGQKRKILLKNLVGLGYKKEDLEKVFDLLLISHQIRAEKISVFDWINIQKHL